MFIIIKNICISLFLSGKENVQSGSWFIGALLIDPNVLQRAYITSGEQARAP